MTSASSVQPGQIAFGKTGDKLMGQKVADEFILSPLDGAKSHKLEDVQVKEKVIDKRQPSSRKKEESKDTVINKVGPSTKEEDHDLELNHSNVSSGNLVPVKKATKKEPVSIDHSRDITRENLLLLKEIELKR